MMSMTSACFSDRFIVQHEPAIRRVLWVQKLGHFRHGFWHRYPRIRRDDGGYIVDDVIGLKGELFRLSGDDVTP